MSVVGPELPTGDIRFCAACEDKPDIRPMSANRRS